MCKFVLLVVAFSLLVSFCACIGDEDISCSAEICSKAECAELPEECDSEDSKSVIFMLSPDICNCCKHCLVNIAEGEPCSVGDSVNGKHTSVCGPGLTCKTARDDVADGTCQKMSTPCALEQQNYDKRREDGFLGTMETKATCDDEGLYGVYKCIPGQTCHCLHSNGSRIFGEANFNTVPNYMSCEFQICGTLCRVKCFLTATTYNFSKNEYIDTSPQQLILLTVPPRYDRLVLREWILECSRKYYEAVAILGHDLRPHEHFRCTADGSYDRVQCINGKCLCVDAEDGAPTYPRERLVPMEEIDSEILPCYTSNVPGQYYQACEKEYMKVFNEVERLKNETGSKYVFGYSLPSCDLDGTYAAVQENKTHKFCVDKKGTPLNVLDKSNTTLKPLIDSMDCNCARATLIMTAIEKPQCLQNGNYNPVQCRRGVCRCVDKDGDQKCSSPTTACEEVVESESSTLQC